MWWSPVDDVGHGDSLLHSHSPWERSPGQNHRCHAKSVGLRRDPQAVLGWCDNILVWASWCHWNVYSGHQDDGARRVAHRTGYGEEDGLMADRSRVQTMLDWTRCCCISISSRGLLLILVIVSRLRGSIIRTFILATIPLQWAQLTKTWKARSTERNCGAAEFGQHVR